VHPILSEVAPLLNRERELERLSARLEAASRAEGALVIIQGLPGLGKTSLLHAAAREAQRRGFEVARARGAQLEGEWPFGIVRQLLEPALRRRTAEERSALLDGAAGLAAGVVLGENVAQPAVVDATSGTLHGLYWLCANLAAVQPLLLAVDDAHWADEASLRFLGMLARRLDALPALVVLAQRPVAPAALAELAADPQVERLGIEPLSPEAIRTLLTDWSPGEVDPEFALACYAATGGNPFFLTRLAAGLQAQGIAFTAEHADRITDVGPGAVRDAVRATLARLPPDTVALAEAATILGDDSDPMVAAELAGLEPEAAEAAAERLVGTGVLADARPLRFVHALVRDAVAAGLSAGVRAALHARAGELLDTSGGAPDAVAAHLLATQPRGRTWVVERLAAAARRAAERGAPQAAMTMLERGLAEPPDAPSRRAELLLDLARAASALGRPEALEHFRAAHALATEPDVRARAALGLTWAGGPALDAAEVIALLDGAIAENDADRELVLELQAARLTAFLTRPALLVPRWEAGEFEHWALLKGATRGERLVLAPLALMRMGLGGQADPAAELAERAAGAHRSDAQGGEGLWLMFIFIALYKTDRLEIVQRVLDRELRAARERGSVVAYALVCNFRGAVALRRGELATAEAEHRASLDAIPPDALQRAGRTSGLIDVLVEAGRLDEAEAILAAGGWQGPLPDDRETNVLLASRSRLRFARGDHPGALADALEARRRLRRPDGGDTNWDGWLRIALLRRLLGEPDAARAEADALLAAAHRFDTPGAVGQALRCCGLIEGGRAGLVRLREAVAHLERSPARLEHAHALVDLGAALRRLGARAEARDPLRDGMDLAAAAGAVPLAERARQELAATGLRVRRAAQTGVAALTPSERRIAEHAATGLTNAQIAQALFVTAKTVEMHLGNAYRKLDITSRHELPRHLQPTDPQ
jgi:DNA-binding CsgD family transcriptional regulator